ncbi:hypothetical protein RJ639_009224 [Escallonia herrerae]|uniref:Transposase (putative) gypsy type domain-containing protein n=1 Tax=Escallonia herrerae TaxID=1293975 RepID=A0AA89AT78_9ASTE|nr:hypothetical protein RJ639_009224 [Escallonia herrerae]
MGTLLGHNFARAELCSGNGHSARAECLATIMLRQNRVRLMGTLLGQSVRAQFCLGRIVFSHWGFCLSRMLGHNSTRVESCSANRDSARAELCLANGHSAQAECLATILLEAESCLANGHSVRAECSGTILLWQNRVRSMGTLLEQNYHFKFLIFSKLAIENMSKTSTSVSSSEENIVISSSSSSSKRVPTSGSWYARLPGLQEPANYRTKFETGIYEEQVKSRYRLPLQPFSLRFFEHYHMAPRQLVPNGWRKLVGLIYLVQTSGYKPDAADFMRGFFEIYFIKVVANYSGWYYIHSRQRLLNGGPKPNKGWHSRYFFVGRLDKGKLLFGRDWNPYYKDFKNPGKPTPNNLTKHNLSHIKLRGGLSIDEPLSKQQLEWARIIPRKPVPAGALIPPPPLTTSSASPVESIPLGVLYMYASGSKILSRFEMARQVAAEEAQQKRDAIKEAKEATLRVEELNKQEADHLAQIGTLETRLEWTKRKEAK